MRQFTEILFQGRCCSPPGCTYSEIIRLYKRFAEGLDISGGLQQVPHPSDEEEAKLCERDYKKESKNLEDTVRDIAMALTGKEIEFKN